MRTAESTLNATSPDLAATTDTAATADTATTNTASATDAVATTAAATNATAAADAAAADVAAATGVAANTDAASATGPVAAADVAAATTDAAAATGVAATTVAAVATDAMAAADVAATADAAMDVAATTRAAADLAATTDAASATDAAAGADVAAATKDAAAPAAAVAPTRSESHLPGWVQVAVDSASLYAADSSSDQVLARLPRHTFLSVLNGGASRLQVQVFSDSGTPGQTGWVTAEQVLPSAPGTDWLVAASATTLWSTSDATAASVRSVDRFAPLQKLEGPQLNRISVNVYASDFSRVIGTGWVDVTATGPALAPQVRVPGPSDSALANRAATGSDQQMTFLNAAAQAARQSSARTGVPASVTVAQAILESDWGRSTLAQDANNYFGMKVLGTLGNDGLVWMPTSEYNASGELYQTTSAFRAYKSLTDSMMDHDRLLQLASRYSAAMQARSDPKQFAALIAQAGYSTDPTYADKLVALMDRYNLYQLDA